MLGSIVCFHILLKLHNLTFTVNVTFANVPYYYSKYGYLVHKPKVIICHGSCLLFYSILFCQRQIANIVLIFSLLNSYQTNNKSKYVIILLQSLSIVAKHFKMICQHDVLHNIFIINNYY